MAKQYSSIIRLMEHCGIDSGGELNLSRIRKQLTAEFGISETGFLEVDGHTYTRHDVLEEIDHPDFAKRFIWHKRIWKCPALLNLLENSEANFFALREEFKLFAGDTEFDALFSPYFAGPFSYISRNCLTENNFIELAQLLEYEDFLQPEEREEAFRPIRVFLDENFRLLRNVNKENYSMMRPKILFWVKDSWHIFFNNLPHEFYDTKNDIVVLLINLGVAVQKSYKSDAREMSDQLIGLADLPESLRQLIVSNHAAYNKTATSSSSGGWRVAWWIFWIIIIIARATSSGGCNDDKPSYQYFEKFPQPTYHLDSNLRIVPDSVYSKNERIDSLLKELLKRKNNN